jgi:hypothetical protein
MVMLSGLGAAPVTTFAVFVSVPRFAISPDATIGLSVISLIAVAAAIVGMLRQRRADRR